MSELLHKRVLLVVRHPVGGIRTYIKYIYQQACFQHYDFTLFIVGEGLDDYFEKIFINNNFEYISCEDSRSLFIKLISYLNNHDVALVHSHGFTAGVISEWVAKFYHMPTLMTAHDVFLEKQFTGMKGWCKKSLFAFIFSRINKIHTVSHDATENLVTFFPDINKDATVCIPHGIDAKRFYSSRKIDLGEVSRRIDCCLIGFFGRFMSQKGFRYLVDAIKLIVENKMVEKPPLVLTFDWGGYVREEYERIELMGLGDYFYMMHYTEDMPGMIKAMDVVAMPSLWESSGLLGMETLVSGVPLIAARCIGLREVLRDTPAIMVEPMNSVSLAKAIANEINSPCKKEFQAFSDIARERFSIHRPALELKKLYDEMLLNKC